MKREMKYSFSHVMIISIKVGVIRNWCLWTECIANWLQKKWTCPFCRLDLMDAIKHWICNKHITTVFLPRKVTIWFLLYDLIRIPHISSHPQRFHHHLQMRKLPENPLFSGRNDAKNSRSFNLFSRSTISTVSDLSGFATKIYNSHNLPITFYLKYIKRIKLDSCIGWKE